MGDPVLLMIGGFTLLVVMWQAAAITARLNRLQRTLDRLARHHGLPAAEGLSEQVKELARDPARKIDAIKAHRDETGAGLAEAKQAVEDYQRTLDR